MRVCQLVLTHPRFADSRKTVIQVVVVMNESSNKANAYFIYVAQRLALVLAVLRRQTTHTINPRGEVICYCPIS